MPPKKSSVKQPRKTTVQKVKKGIDDQEEISETTVWYKASVKAPIREDKPY
tara:strand:+ start:232 stop:384 length:153 start_codon:yes stop_codon:yes gene_type:complete